MAACFLRNTSFLTKDIEINKASSLLKINIYRKKGLNLMIKTIKLNLKWVDRIL